MQPLQKNVKRIHVIFLKYWNNYIVLKLRLHNNKESEKFICKDFSDSYKSARQHRIAQHRSVYI